jgi:vancomycin resistance protein VanJ
LRAPSPARRGCARRLARAALLGLADLYLLGLVGWLALYMAARDATPLLFSVNAFGVYLFAPLPLALAAGLIGRHWPTLGLGAMGALAWLALFGRLFMPSLSVGAAPAGQPLRVMTTNLLGFNTDTAGVLAALRASGADLIALQELNPEQARAIQRELSEEYPYQVLDPRQGVRGGGVISRYPLTPTGEQVGGRWIGEPQVVQVDVKGQAVTFIRLHALSGAAQYRAREAAVRALDEYAARHSGPLIVAGDLNATPLNTAHRLLTRHLRDAWEAQGWGLGHTFPGALSPGSSRPVIGGVPVPRWLIRIDYILYAHGVAATAAGIGPWDGTSDHRPVLADLVLTAQ